MRHLARSFLPHLQPHLSTPSFLSTSSPPPPPPNSTTTLSSSELSSLRHLLPSLISSGHPLAAIHLLNTALLTNPPLSSLPLPLLADRLSSLPSLSPSLSLLSALRFNPLRPSPLPFCSLLLSSLFRRRRPRHAAKIFAWLCRPDSPCRPDAEVYGIAVRGFCERGRALEAVRVAREMARDGVLVTGEVRVWVCLALLGEARVREGLEFDGAAGRGGVDGVREVLDRIIRDWED